MESFGSATWTKTLIKDMKAWYECKFCCLNYLTQALTGHGFFCKFFYDTGKDDLFVTCTEERRMIRNIYSSNVQDGAEQKQTDFMLSSRNNWLTVVAILSGIMNSKERQETARQAADHDTCGSVSHHNHIITNEARQTQRKCPIDGFCACLFGATGGFQ